MITAQQTQGLATLALALAGFAFIATRRGGFASNSDIDPAVLAEKVYRTRVAFARRELYPSEEQIQAIARGAALATRPGRFIHTAITHYEVSQWRLKQSSERRARLQFEARQAEIERQRKEAFLEQEFDAIFERLWNEIDPSHHKNLEALQVWFYEGATTSLERRLGISRDNAYQRKRRGKILLEPFASPELKKRLGAKLYR